MTQRARSESSADHHVADPQPPALPFALGEALDAAEHDVRPQPAAVAAERPDRPVGGDEQREDVEALGRVEARELRVGAGHVLHDGGDLGGAGRPVLDERLAVGGERGVQAEQLRPRARRDEAVRAADDDEPVAGDPVALTSAVSSASPAIDLTG